MPDYHDKDVKTFLDSVYKFMVQGGRTKELFISQLFGISFGYLHHDPMDNWDSIFGECKDDLETVNFTNVLANGPVDSPKETQKIGR